MPSKEFSTVLIQEDKGIVKITLNRPEKKNAMSPQLHKEMLVLMQDLTNRALESVESVRAIILTGSGDSFCAGQDLKEFFYETQNDPKRYDAIARMSKSWGELLRLFPAPTIAAVNGWCIGGGFRVMCHCDLAIAAEKARFALSEINFGIFPAAGALKAPMEVLSARDLAYLVLTGNTIDADQAKVMRLVNNVVSNDTLLKEAYSLAEELKQKNPIALRYAKLLIHRARYLSFEESQDYESAKMQEMSMMQGGEWVKEGLGQFLEKKYKPAVGTYERS